MSCIPLALSSKASPGMVAAVRAGKAVSGAIGTSAGTAGTDNQPPKALQSRLLMRWALESNDASAPASATPGAASAEGPCRHWPVWTRSFGKIGPNTALGISPRPRKDVQSSSARPRLASS